MFRNLFLLLGLLVPFAAFSQGETCQQAISVPVTSSRQYASYTINPASLQSSPGVSTCANAMASPYVDSWFSFTTTSPFTEVRFRGNSFYTMEFYLGSNCASLQYLSCQMIFQNDSSYQILSLPIGTTVNLRMVKQTGAMNLNLSVATHRNPQRIVSQPLTGNWDLSSTWQGGIVPQDLDTVVIVQGSYVIWTHSRANTLGKLIVGQGQGPLATLFIEPYYTSRNSLTIADSLVVHDSAAFVVSDQVTSPSTNVTLQGAWVLNGRMRADQTTLIFSGSRKQNVSGRGRFLSPLPRIRINKTADSLFLQRSIPFSSTAEATAGVVVSQGGQLIPQKVSSNSAMPQIEVQGSRFVNTVIGPGDRFVLHFLSSTPRVPVRQLIDYAPVGTPFFLRSSLNAADTLVYNPGIVLAGFSTNGVQGVLRFQPSDTLEIGYCNMGSVQKAENLNHVRIRHDIDTVRGFHYIQFHHPSGTRVIQLDQAQLLPRSASYLISFLYQRPTGAVPAPLVKPIGKFVLRVRSNLPTWPATVQMRITAALEDSTNSFPRAIQGLSPAGTWTNVSDMPYINTNSNIRTSSPMDFSLGQYFAFATADPDRDLRLVDATFKYPSAFSGPGMRPQDLLIRIQNRKGPTALQAVLRWSINTSPAIEGVDTLIINQAVGIGTFSLSPNKLVSIPSHGSYTCRIVLEPSFYNLLSDRFDTLTIPFDNTLRGLPYNETFTYPATTGTLPAGFLESPLVLPRFSRFDIGGGSLNFNSVNTTNSNLIQLYFPPVRASSGTLYWSAMAAITKELILPVLGDSVVLAFSSDTGTSYQTIYRWNHTRMQTPDSANAGVLQLYSGSIPLPRASVGHLRLSVYQAARNGDFFGSLDNIRLSNQPLSLPTSQGARSAWSVFPNPSTGRVSIQGSLQPQAWKLTSLSGQVLDQGDWQGTSLTLPETLANGLYLLSLQARPGAEWQTVRLSIQKR